MNGIYLQKCDGNIDFNTGRPYGPEGQVIRAKWVSDKPCPIFPDLDQVVTVEFNDTTRRVRGRVEITTQAVRDTVSANDIMRKYDENRYDLI